MSIPVFRPVAIVLLFLAATPLLAVDLQGTWVMETFQGDVVLTLDLDEAGSVSGRLAGGTVTVAIQGKPEGPGHRGTATTPEGAVFGFEAVVGQDGQLYFQLYPLDEAGNPAYEFSEMMAFTRQAPAGAAVEGPAAMPDAGMTAKAVTINRVKLTAERIGRLESLYQTTIPEGSYWYDTACGAWGMEGGATQGFLPPGLDLPGPMPADISGGGTAIFINGREIHVQDQAALQQIFGITIPGRYWLDSQGNLGIEGGPALINMRIAAGEKYGSVHGAGGTVGHDGQGGAMFSGKSPTGKSIFWYSGM